MKKLLDTNYWDSVAEETRGYHLERNIAIYKREEHIGLIRKWGGDLTGKRILKTDLYEEAFGEDHFLFWILGQNANVFGMDISCKIAEKAQLRSKEFKPCLKYSITSDVRECSFKNSSFDLIVSNSTLDNLSPQDFSKGLAELRRVLKPAGVLILTLDNGNNPLYSLGYILEKFLKTNRYYQGRCYSVKKAKYFAEENNFTVEDITAIVHIPTPFNRIAILLKKINPKAFEGLIRNCVSLFSKIGLRKTPLATGWFLALKLRKNGQRSF